MCSWLNLAKFLKQGKNGITMVICHEQGDVTSFLSLGSLELVLVQFP
jgi:hypothetical protein